MSIISTLFPTRLSRRITSLPARAEGLSDERLVKEVRRNWKGVVQENRRHRHLVSEHDFSVWEDFERRFGPEVDRIAHDQDREAAMEVARAMSSHTHAGARALSRAR